jgi:hypothetical protein
MNRAWRRNSCTGQSTDSVKLDAKGSIILQQRMLEGQTRDDTAQQEYCDVPSWIWHLVTACLSQLRSRVAKRMAFYVGSISNKQK